MPASNAPKLEIAIAELSVLLKTVVNDVSEIKNRLQVMDEQFARKGELEAARKATAELAEIVNNLRIELAVTAARLATWGIIGGIIITLLAAGISALQIHL
jgi:hypothetical protein